MWAYGQGRGSKIEGQKMGGLVESQACKSPRSAPADSDFPFHHLSILTTHCLRLSSVPVRWVIITHSPGICLPLAVTYLYFHLYLSSHVLFFLAVFSNLTASVNFHCLAILFCFLTVDIRTGCLFLVALIVAAVQRLTTPFLLRLMGLHWQFCLAKIQQEPSKGELFRSSWCFLSGLDQRCVRNLWEPRSMQWTLSWHLCSHDHTYIYLSCVVSSHSTAFWPQVILTAGNKQCHESYISRATFSGPMISK